MDTVRLPAILILFLVLTGCGTMSNGKKWGQDATWAPGWDRVGKAAYNAAVSPLTWGPAVGAAIFQIDDWDRNLSNWAADKTPVFGSQKSASNWSDALVYTSGALYGATALLTPSGNQSEEWLMNKVKGGIVGGAAVLLSEGGAELTHTVVKRNRPDGGGNDSFPSGHATAAASFATLATKNVEALELSRPAEVASDISLWAIAASSAWARVEARRHYTSDVLAGMALGHFVSAFVNDAFLGNEKPSAIKPELDVSRSGFYLGVSWNR